MPPTHLHQLNGYQLHRTAHYPPIVVAYPHHIIQRHRGCARKILFPTENSRARYLAKLSSACQEFDIPLHGYCLMDTHAHVLVTLNSPDAAIRLLTTLSDIGPVTRTLLDSPIALARTFAIFPSESRAHFVQAMRYVDLNPVVSGQAKYPEDYRWSSYRSHIGLAYEITLDEHPWLCDLNSSQKYREFVEQKVPAIQLQHIRSGYWLEVLADRDESAR